MFFQVFLVSLKTVESDVWRITDYYIEPILLLKHFEEMQSPQKERLDAGIPELS